MHLLFYSNPFLSITERSTSELASMTTTKTAPSNSVFMYYAKVVPTLYSNDVSEFDLLSNQFSVTEHQKILPSNAVRIGTGQAATVTSASPTPALAAHNSGAVFFYELSPIMVQATVKWRPFLSFITQLCAILGGVFTVASILDKLVYGSVKHVQKKVQLGKLN